MRKTLLAVLTFFASTLSFAAQPEVNKSAALIDAPRLLDFAMDVEAAQPDLSEQTANRLYDLHGNIGNCDSMDFVLSTAGNYHMALRDLWYDVVLPKHSDVIKNWYYTTSPPIAQAQVKNGQLTVGNLVLKCTPMVVVAPKPEIDALVAAGVTSGSVVKVLNNRGNVLIVKKGNPKNIRDIRDLGRPNVKVVTPNPVTEPSTFKNYSSTLYNVTLNQYGEDAANEVFNEVFNGKNGKWLAGARIHHREVPWSVAYGNADVGVLFYHIARNLVKQFPDVFEIVPLGGTADNPQPLVGNNVGAHFAVRIDVPGKPLNANQSAAREAFLSELASEQFKGILEKHGLARP
jgi:hypothetical protein